MPCRQVSTYNGAIASSGGYATEAECNQACQEGACCEGTTCTVKPACQCQGAGKTFKGVGTTCTPNPCCSCDALVSVTIKLASVFGGAEITRTGCSGQFAISSTFVNWSCGVNGFVLNVANIYGIIQDGICNFEYSNISDSVAKSYSAKSISVSQDGPCGGVVVGNCTIGWPVQATLTISDFMLTQDIPTTHVNVRDACWGYGPPSTDSLFPQWVKIGPASNPLP